MALPRMRTDSGTAPISRWLAGQDRPAPAWVLVTAGLSRCWSSAAGWQQARWSPPCTAQSGTR